MGRSGRDLGVLGGVGGWGIGVGMGEGLGESLGEWEWVGVHVGVAWGLGSGHVWRNAEREGGGWVDAVCGAGGGMGAERGRWVGALRGLGVGSGVCCAHREFRAFDLRELSDACRHRAWRRVSRL